MKRTEVGRASRRKRGYKTRHRKFPYERVAKMWGKGITIGRIARAIDREDKDNPNDPYHSLPNFLYEMAKGYTTGIGPVVKLPHRVSKAALRAARSAGLRAW